MSQYNYIACSSSLKHIDPTPFSQQFDSIICLHPDSMSLHYVLLVENGQQKVGLYRLQITDSDTVYHNVGILVIIAWLIFIENYDLECMSQSALIKRQLDFLLFFFFENVLLLILEASSDLQKGNSSVLQKGRTEDL